MTPKMDEFDPELKYMVSLLLLNCCCVDVAYLMHTMGNSIS